MLNTEVLKKHIYSVLNLAVSGKMPQAPKNLVAQSPIVPLTPKKLLAKIDNKS